MSGYVEFTLEDGTRILIESKEEGGLVQAGIGDKVREAGEEFLLGVQRASKSAQMVLQQVLKDNSPDEVELTFGLKASAEFKTLVIADAGIEASYSLKLTWKKPQENHSLAIP